MHLQGQNGLMATWRTGIKSRGLGAWLLAAGMIGFYIDLYWTSHLDPVAHALGMPSKWTLYGALYSVLMVGGGIAYLKKHGNSRYNQARIAVNLFVQIVLAFLLPLVMPLFSQPEFYPSYFWPLKYDLLFPSTLSSLPLYLAIYAVVGSLLFAPIAAVLWGKRWYCSWICGCGGLANTFGDPWRHLTSKSTQAWRFEKGSIYLVLVLAIAMTAVVGLGHLMGDSHPAFRAFSDSTRSWYGFFVGSILAGVVGTGLYPLLGPRVWCRNFCPMAALLGLSQKLGRFRIRVKQDMCISCGNCSAYCEMGIDVRAYAQNNEDFTRASCVGCGMCAHVCPRGVLRLESSPAPADAAERAYRVVLDI